MTQVLLSSQSQTTNQRVLDILFDSDDISWKSIIFGLIQAEEMNPWDIDISVIAHKFIATLAQLKQLDFRVSGKIIVASAILLRLKTDKLMDEEIAALDQLINSAEQEDVDLGFFDEFPVDYPVDGLKSMPGRPRLVPKTPQPRKRKVSVYDLVEALEKALETEARRPPRIPMSYKEVKAPVNHVDISEVIKEVYGRINAHYAANPGRKARRLTFSEIIPSENKQDKVMTFIPLLHLDNQRKVDISQEEHFGEIEIDLLVKDANLDEIAAVAEIAAN